MINEGVHFRSVVSRWFEIWENKCPNSNQKNARGACVYDKSAYIVQNPTDELSML